MNILALVTEAFGGAGGIAQYNRDVIGALAAADFVDEIFVLPRLAQGAIRLPPGVRQAQAEFGRLSYAFRTWREILRRRPDLLFCGHLYMAPLAHLISKVLGVSYVVQLHGVEAWRRPSSAQRLALEHADLIFCVSRHTRAQILTWTRIKAEKVVVVPNTFGPAFAPGDRQAARNVLGVDHCFVLLTVGRLDQRERYKGHDRVIRALSHVRAGGRPILYLIAGNGDDRPRLEALAKSHGVDRQVRFVGLWPQDALPDLYRAADLFVMPSSGEGFGIVFLEAMACGTPALGLAAGGAVDPLDFGAWGRAVVEDQWQAALEESLSLPRPDQENMTAAIRNRFGQRAFAAEIVRQVERVAARTHTSSAGRGILKKSMAIK